MGADGNREREDAGEGDEPEGRVTAGDDDDGVALFLERRGQRRALAAASVGIAMGTAGSDVALETADVALMADDLSKLVEALHIGRRTRQIVRQNIALSLVILAVLVPGALAGVFTLPVAVGAHEVSELFVILNGLRLARR